MNFKDKIFTQLKEQKRFLELDLIASLLDLKDVVHNHGNLGIREKKVGDRPESISVKSTPIIVDFALPMASMDRREALDSTATILDQVPGTSPTGPITRQLLGSYRILSTHSRGIATS